MSAFRIIGGNPAPVSIAPYIALLAREVGATVNSLYRGADAAWILHRHGKSTQGELYASLPPGVANPPGRSTHELRSDGVAFRGPVGRRLADWQLGMDVNDSDVEHMIEAARRHGWVLFRPYPNARVEYHHLCFAYQPRPHSQRMRLKLIRLRATLPRR